MYIALVEEQWDLPRLQVSIWHLSDFRVARFARMLMCGLGMLLFLSQRIMTTRPAGVHLIVLINALVLLVHRTVGVHSGHLTSSDSSVVITLLVLEDLAREREAVAIPDLQLIGLAPNQLLTPEMGKTSLVAGEAIPLELSQWSIPCSLFTIVIEDI